MVNSEEIVERTFYISLLSTMLEMGYADERIHENKGQKGTGRTDG